MNSFGFSNQIDLDGSPNNLPADIHLQLRDILDSNSPDKDWRALVRVVGNKYHIKTSRVESWSSAINYSESPTDKLLTELAGQGITVRELADYLDQLMIETYPLGLRGFEEIVVQKEPGDSKEVTTGDSLFLEVQATGHPYPRYQWFFCPDGEDDFVRLEGRIESILRIDNVTKNNAGSYSCQIHNCGDPEKTKLTKITLVCVKPAPKEDEQQFTCWETGENLIGRSATTEIIDPRRTGSLFSYNGHFNLIIQQPLDLDVEMNSPFLIEVGTQGTPPILYQWFKDGKLMQGKNSNMIQVLQAMPEDFGEYYCIVQDGRGKTEKSQTATIKRWPLLNPSENGEWPSTNPKNEIMIISQPKSCKVHFGGEASFYCEAKCNAPLQYLWFKDGKPMDDQREPNIRFSNIQDRLKAGMYQCYVYPKGGSIATAMISAPALLTIEVPPVNENIEYNPSDKVALLIGNSDYRCETSLKAPSSDVKVLSEAFRMLNFKVISLINLSKTEIESAVLHFCKLVDKNVYAVFYFCGHGFEEDGCTFLVPTDAVHGYGINDCVCVESVLDNIQKRSPPLVLMIIDICRIPNKIQNKGGLPRHIRERVAKGNTVYCYATSQGLNAYEDSRNGLLVRHLQPLLHQKLGVDQMVSSLKEEFNREQKYTEQQLPELRSNHVEPRRTLADKISSRGETELFHKRSKLWQESWVTPENRKILVREVGVILELDFQAEFSNVLHVFVIVKNKGITTDCTGFIQSWPPQVSLIGKSTPSGVPCKTMKFSFADIQKLVGDMIVSLGVQYQLKNDPQDRLCCLYLNLGLPLVSKLMLWKPQPGFTPLSREGIEQTEDESLN